MNEDRQERIDTLKKHEELLTNGHRGDPGAVSDMLVEISRTLRVQVATEFVTATDCADLRENCPKGKAVFGWPAAVASLGLIVSVTMLIIRMFP